jgi:hypothetical protein
MYGEAVRRVLTYVETNAGMAFDHWCAAWTFDLELWGYCGQGPDEPAAVASLHRQVNAVLGQEVELVVSERTTAETTGAETAFARDHRPCTSAEVDTTLAVLAEIRPQTIALVQSCPDAELDWDDPDRILPSYASWRTIRQLAWHVVDTESRYYLPCAGLGYRDAAPDLLTELVESAAHVRSVLTTMPADIIRTDDDHGTWTTVKVLRRLAWHERGELDVMRQLAARARP